jgi:hypothetical protein
VQPAGAGPVVITLPAAMKVGTDIAADAVLVRACAGAAR